MQEPSQDNFHNSGDQSVFGLPSTDFDFVFRASPGAGENLCTNSCTALGSSFSRDISFNAGTGWLDKSVNDEQLKVVSKVFECLTTSAEKKPASELSKHRGNYKETINPAAGSLTMSLPSRGRRKPNTPRPFRLAATGSPMVLSAISPAMNSAASLTDDQPSLNSDDASSVADSEASSSGPDQDSGAEARVEVHLSSRSKVRPDRIERHTQPSQKKKVSSVEASQPRRNVEYSDPMRDSHFHLLGASRELDELKEVQTAPVFTEVVRRYAHKMAVSSASDPPFSQYGLLAGDITGTAQEPGDNRIFWNISAPSSFFICGSQGSGKSHTLSCLLENALIPCSANQLPRPLTGIVFHYDTFISDTGGSPCEAAWLSSNPNVKVRVLCPPTNTRTMKTIYSRFPNIVVEELRLNECDLNTKRMMDLMAVATTGNIPLYLHVVNRILRDMRVIQQHKHVDFNYEVFKRKLDAEELTDQQRAPLKQRLETLESFMVQGQAKSYDGFSARNGQNGNKFGAESRGVGKWSATGTDWKPRRGTLTIVDLSCPCVTAEMACSLFNICLSLFLEQSSEVGRVIALDEAHKYMTNSAECQTLTEALLATIRLQRHLGARVIISTQEPTISPKLLDLCSVTIVHRFTSPDWLNALRKHLAGVSNGARVLEKALRMQEGAAYGEDDDDMVDGAGTLSLGDGDPGMELFPRIVGLRVGEALMFAPSAIIGVRKTSVPEHSMLSGVKRLSHGVMKVRIRNRTTQDGGRSIMAS